MFAEMEDIEFAIRLRLYNEGKLLWMKKDGTVLKINNMSTDHLINVYKMLKRKRYTKDILCIDEQMNRIPRRDDEEFDQAEYDDQFGGDIGDLEDAMG